MGGQIGHKIFSNRVGVEGSVCCHLNPAIAGSGILRTADPSGSGIPRNVDPKISVPMTIEGLSGVYYDRFVNTEFVNANVASVDSSVIFDSNIVSAVGGVVLDSNIVSAVSGVVLDSNIVSVSGVKVSAYDLK